jgi:hypothetical protein
MQNLGFIKTNRQTLLCKYYSLNAKVGGVYVLAVEGNYDVNSLFLLRLLLAPS